MPTLTAIIAKNADIQRNIKFSPKDKYGNESNFIQRQIASKNFVAEQFTNPKFLNDKILEENTDFVIGTEGVILNLTDLKKKFDAENTFDLISKMYLSENENFVKKLKGDFSGFIFDKKAGKWIVFTNQTGSKRVFYFENNDYFIFSSELKEICFLLEQLNIEKPLNISAAYMLLTCGFMLGNNTLADNVKRLSAGHYLVFENNKIAIKEYFHLRNIPQTTDSKAEIIEKMDTLFSQAVRLEFEKDKEYNYCHIATLSGGLDSRMTVLVAHKLGYTEQLNFTFSQSNHLDEVIAKKISTDHRFGFIFQSLDGGNYLKSIDKNVYYNDGLVYFPGSAHLLNSIENINFAKYGIVHTGILGDAIIGTYLGAPYPRSPSVEMGVNSRLLLSKLRPFFDEIAKNFPTEELYKIYNRGFLGIMGGYLYIDIFSQAASPFMDVDFLSYCYSIPEKYKFKEQIYLDWIAAKYPEFARYAWEKTGISPLKSNSLKRFFCYGYYRRMSKKFFDMLSGKIKSGMNPFDLWLEENDELRNYLDNYFAENIHLLNNYKELKHDCENVFKIGKAMDKFTVLTLLSAVKLHFEND